MADEWIMKMGIIEETKMLQIMCSIYDDIVSWMRQWRNISLHIVEISKEDLRKTLDEELPEGADCLFFPSELTLYSSERSPSSPRFSQAAIGTSTYILSTTPDKRTFPSLNFLNMESRFVVCLWASLLSMSALMTFINRLSRQGANWSLKDFGHQFFDNLWRIILLFFFEPFVRTSRILSWRIVVSVWLIAISFIYIDLCANLNSKFKKIEYDYVDSMSNLPRERYSNVIVFKDYVEEVFVNKMAEIDDNYRELKKQMRRVDVVDLLDLSFSKLIESREYLISAELFGKIGIRELVRIQSESPPRGLVSFSEPLYSTFIIFPIAPNASARTVDVINGLCLMEMEARIMKKYFNEMDYYFFGMKWNKPEETFQDMTFGDIKSLLYLYALGSFLSSVFLIVELTTSFVRYKLNFTSKRRRNKMAQKWISVLEN